MNPVFSIILFIPLLTPTILYPPWKSNLIFTDSEVEGAKKVRELQHNFYWIGKYNFKTYL